MSFATGVTTAVTGAIAALVRARATTSGADPRTKGSRILQRRQCRRPPAGFRRTWDWLSQRSFDMDTVRHPAAARPCASCWTGERGANRGCSSAMAALAGRRRPRRRAGLFTSRTRNDRTVVCEYTPTLKAGRRRSHHRWPRTRFGRSAPTCSTRGSILYVDLPMMLRRPANTSVLISFSVTQASKAPRRRRDACSIGEASARGLSINRADRTRPVGLLLGLERRATRSRPIRVIRGDCPIAVLAERLAPTHQPEACCDPQRC